MNRLHIGMSILIGMIALTASAEPVYVFEADDATGALRAQYVMSDGEPRPDLSWEGMDTVPGTGGPDAKQEIRRRYKAFVTQAQYDAGWAALAQSVKDSARLAAQQERADIDKKMDKLVRAFALTVLDEINALRQKAGLPERTVEQLKQAVAQKYQALQ